jgi:hypothetical protein
MIKRFGELLARLGFRRGGGRHFFALDDNLHTALVKLANQEQRPAEEVQVDQAVRSLFRRGKQGVEGWNKRRAENLRSFLP